MKKNIAIAAVLALFIILTGIHLISQLPDFIGITKRINTELVIYDAPEGIRTADMYDMSTATEISRNIALMISPYASLSVDGYKLPVYETNICNSHGDSAALPLQSRTPVSSFDFNGTVQAKISVNDFIIDSAVVSPLSEGVIPKIENNGKTVSFTISEPGSYTVVFNGEQVRAFHIFANEIEKDKPESGDSDVIYYGAGEWYTDTITLKSGQTLYIDGGAVIHGNVLISNADNVKITGRGIIDGSLYGGNADNRTVMIPINISNSTNVEISGIMILNSNCWNLQGYSSDNIKIKNVKIISSRANGDGITLQSCTNLSVENCFLRTWDDSLVVKNYEGSSKNITFSNIVLWTDLAQSMEIGYETNGGEIDDAYIENVKFNNITVIYNLHKPVISIHNSDECEVRDVEYNNIVVENADMQFGNTLIEFEVCESSWSTTAGRGSIDGVDVNGLKVLAGTNKTLTAKIEGFGSDYFVKNIRFSNMEIYGQYVNGVFSVLQFDINKKNTDNIYIS